MRGADVHSVELQPAELIDRATEMEREPAARPKASVTEQQAIAFEIAAEVGEGRPGDVIGNPALQVEAAHVGERRQVHVHEEIASQRRGLGHWAWQLKWRRCAHVRLPGGPAPPPPPKSWPMTFVTPTRIVVAETIPVVSVVPPTVTWPFTLRSESFTSVSVVLTIRVLVPTSTISDVVAGEAEV